MTSYREFQAELERLHQQAESARRREKGEALERIRALILEYRLLPSDLGFTDAPKARAASGTPKFRDPETGATWSGRGRAPGWLAGKDREQYRIG